ncbi:predicted metal-dependent hydrolase of the TIM-barrel fold [Longilinea arvoryzae]|uniref:Predicted metal-dependent hydrolase of the TIM-barrel fold n=2 Tax=Longilinea arvoryzae TaxID=360412 RepID=A0A0S7BL52_9CHLR|nr:predicted metal-dependent hydrolase of the TIM-barrel fold [Longilinea arvoryzae]
MTYFDACAFIGRWPGEKLAFDSVDGLLSNMRRLEIDRALVTHTLAWQNSPALGNRLLMEAISGHPELEPCWVVTPGLQVEDLGGEVAFCEQMAQNGVRAVRLYPREHVFSLNDGPTEKLLSELDRRNYLVVIDLDQIFTQSGLYDYSAASLDVLDTLCRTYPQLSILLTRVGYRAFHILMPMMQTNPNLFLDLSFFATHQGVEAVTERLGENRLLFGTGQPFVDAGGAMLRLVKAGIPQEAIRRIASKNLEQLLDRVKVAPLPGMHKEASVQIITQSADLSTERIPQDIEITDAHVHMGPYHKFYIPQNSAEDMLRVMDHLSIARSCISSHLAISGDWYTGNRLTAQAVQQYPDRFIGYVVVSPNEPELAEDEMRRAFDEWGFKGIKLVPDTHLQPIGGPGYQPVFEFASKRDAFVLVHTYHSSHFDDPQLFGEVAGRYPDVPILMVHSGALPAGFNGAIDLVKKHPNLYLDISGSFITGEWIRRMVLMAGADRVLYSSDQPFIDPRYSLGRLLFAGLSKQDLSLVLGGNIRRLLGLAGVS